jgi:hypothetical protein
MTTNIPVTGDQSAQKSVPVKQKPVPKAKIKPVNILSPNPRIRSKDVREVNFY